MTKPTKKIICCKVLQLFTDFVFFIIGVFTIVVVIATASGKLTDARLTLGEACLESDTHGFVKIVFVWGIVLAAIVSLTSCLGIYSSLGHKWYSLYAYSMLGYILTLMELLFFLTLDSHLYHVTRTTGKFLKQVVVRYYTGPFRSDLTTFSGAWDHLHRLYHCCGVDGGKAFNTMVNWNRTWLEKYEDPFFETQANLEEFRVITVLPYTCCKYKDESHGEYKPEAGVADIAPLLLDEDCPSSPTEENSYSHVSCLDVLSRYVSQATSTVFYVSISLELLQFAAALCALYTSRASLNLRLRGRMIKKRLLK